MPVPAYPKRERFLAHRLCRLLTKTAAAQELGPEVTWMLTVIVHQEDAKRYSGAVTYWNEQLMALCGFRSKGRLIRARQAAVDSGWLHYETGGRNQPGRYWCLVPAGYEQLPDGPCDESGSFQNRTDGGVNSFHNRTAGNPEFHNGTSNGTQTELGRNSDGALSTLTLDPTPTVSNKFSTNETQYSFPTKDGKEWFLPDGKLAEWQETYPRLDVPSELRKARQWLLDNPAKQKTFRGMTRFLGAWLTRAQDSGRGARKEPSAQESAAIMERRAADAIAREPEQLDPEKLAATKAVLEARKAAREAQGASS